MGCIYCARNKTNKKCYIGQTRYELQRRRTAHETNARWMSSPFYDALRNDGCANFEWFVVYDDVPDCDLFQWEGKAMLLYDSGLPNGYNVVIHKTDGSCVGKLFHRSKSGVRRCRRLCDSDFQGIDENGDWFLDRPDSLVVPVEALIRQGGLSLREIKGWCDRGLLDVIDLSQNFGDGVCLVVRKEQIMKLLYSLSFKPC